MLQQSNDNGEPLYDIGTLKEEQFSKNFLEILSLNHGVFVLNVKYWVDGQDMGIHPPARQQHAFVWFAEPDKNNKRFLFNATAARSKLMVIEDEDTMSKCHAMEAFHRQFDLPCYKMLITDSFCFSRRGETPPGLLDKLYWAYDGTGDRPRKAMNEWDWDGKKFVKRENLRKRQLSNAEHAGTRNRQGKREKKLLEWIDGGKVNGIGHHLLL